MKKNICVIIPCYKVKSKIYNVVKKINFKIVDHVIVVDDYSKDGSRDLVLKYKMVDHI